MDFKDYKISPSLYKKKNLTTLVIFTAIFCLFFILTYKPFNSDKWYNLTNHEYYFYSAILVLIGVLVVALSRIIMYRHTRNNDMTVLKYGLWILAEIFFMSFFYTLVACYFGDSRTFVDIYKVAASNTLLILIIPYTIITLYILWRETKTVYYPGDDKTRINNPSFAHGTAEVISFKDERGELQLSIKRSDLFYIESSDNYVQIWHMTKHGLSHFLLRNSLKNLEKQFEGSNISRVHRSFIVNFEQIKIAHKEKTGLFLNLGLEDSPDIPVSKTYGEKVTKWLLSSAD
ncbi:MAG: LytTR family DNA-binding domain-containing protein [Bacteroidales bacterium]